MTQKIAGVVPPLVTPFTEDEELDLEALRAEIRYMVDVAGVHGIAIGGSTGEGHTLTTDEIRTLIGTACDEVAGKVPVVAGIIVDSTRQAIERGQAVADLDVAALQITPVHYLFKPTEEMMYKHFDRVAAATGVPVMIYNVVPWCYLSPELLTKIITEVDGVIGVKQSAGDLNLLANLMLQLGDRGLVMAATDALLYSAYSLGAHGSIAAILPAAPKLSVQLWDAVQAGDHVKARALHEKLLPIWNAVLDENLPANVKTAMAMQGRQGGHPRSPMPASSAAQRERIRSVIQAEIDA